jgi:hypothetical protein
MSSSSIDRSPFPEEVFVEDLNLTRSNDLVQLDAPPITMTLADQDHVKGLVAFYTTSKIRHRTYLERTWEIIPWIKRYDLTDNLNDPCGDFHTILSHINDPVLHRFPVGRMDEREIEEYCSNTIKWFKSDHLSFYTDWSQMYYSRYDDSHGVFSFFTTSGEMTSMVQWFNKSRSDFDDSDINVAKICSCIWKRIHPPSYLLYRQKKIEASPDQNGYDTASFRRMKLRFDSLPHSFSIMKKRAFSIIAGDGSHFISYLAVDFGAHFQEENSTNRDSTFITKIDSGDGSANMYPFIQWVFAIIYELEVWVTQYLNTSALGLIESPYLAKIGRKRKRQIQSKEHIVCSIPITRVTRAPTQEDTCNCGIYLLINTGAAFLEDRNIHMRWNKVHNAHALWTLVLKPFWELPKKQRRVRLEERITKFRLNFYTLLRVQSRDLTKWKPYRDRPSSSLSPLATAPSNELVTNDTNTAANKITPADNNTMDSNPDSDDSDGEGGKYITASEQADKSFAGMFSTHLKRRLHDQQWSLNKLDCKEVVGERNPLR